MINFVVIAIQWARVTQMLIGIFWNREIYCSVHVYFILLRQCTSLKYIYINDYST